jgi:taspase (threonine aspartase 1)
MLVGDGARKWAVEQGMSSNNNLITSRTLTTYNNHLRRIEDSKRASSSHLNGSSIPKKARLDTVGAVAISKTGVVASGVSSGGISMKTPGRVGQAAMYGAGCWAKDKVAVTTSGVGEYLMRTLLAKEIADSLNDKALAENLSKDILLDAFTSSFTESPLLKDINLDERKGGLLAILNDPNEIAANVEVLVAHNTQTMCIGFMTSEQTVPETLYSARSDDANASDTVVSVVSLSKTAEEGSRTTVEEVLETMTCI